MTAVPQHQGSQRAAVWLLPLLLAALLLPALAGSAAAGPGLLARLKEHRASLRCQDLKVALLLRGLGKQAGINIVVADAIDDTITLDLVDLSLYDIFQTVVEAKHLHYLQKNNVLLVERQSDFQSRGEELATVRLCTRYNNASTYLDQLKTLLSPAGTINITGRGNCYVVTDRQGVLSRVEQLLGELDQPIPQVHIEARVVTLSSEAKKRLGIVWGADNQKTTESVKVNAQLGVTSPTTTITFGFLHSDLDLDIELQALQQENMLELLSAPRILVLNDKEAEIKQGKEVPYVSQSGDIINTSFREANLGLKVTPHVIRDQFIDLEVLVTNDSVDQTTTANGEPLINKQQIRTNLFLENGRTVVIGGILQKTTDHQDSRVPGLSRIPLLGNLFRSTDRLHEKSELLVFLTPTIVTLPSGDRGDSRSDRKPLGRHRKSGRENDPGRQPSSSGNQPQ